MTDETTRSGGGTTPASPTPQGFSTQATSGPTTAAPTGAPRGGSGQAGGQDRQSDPSSGGGSSGSKAAAGDLKGRLHDDVEQAREGLKSYSNSAMDRMHETLNEEAGYAARQVAGVADALKRVGEELEGGEQARIGRTARRLGETVQSFARDIEGKDAGEIVQLAESLGRRQPIAFLGVAALAGLAASRFITASTRAGSGSGRGSSGVGASGNRTGASGREPAGQSSGRAPGSSPLTPASSARPAGGSGSGTGTGGTAGGRTNG